MSEVKNIESVYVPALFTTAGRLPSDPQKVSDNYDLQMAETEKYRQKLCPAKFVSQLVLRRYELPHP